MKKEKKKSTYAWIWDFAGEHRPAYVLSVVSAIIGVACGLVPFFLTADLIGKLLSGCKEMAVYGKTLGIIAVFWIARYLFHSISTTMSHKATFAVLGNIRKRCCAKLTRVPLGYMLDTPSGSIKNILVERIDSIETTMAHIIPEFTSNLLVPLLLLVYLFILDWRMALAVLVTVPLGFGAFCGMKIGYEESYLNTVNKTKILNDTAVEYINGIEVIKAFGKAQSSYERFVIAAKEGASCYVEWMRRCNIFFCAAMSVFPATMLGVLPIGGLLFRSGGLSAEVFIQVILFSVGLIASLITVMSYNDDLAKLGTIIGEVTGILELEELQRPGESKTVPKDKSIVLKDVTFGYHEKEVLHGISMEIKEGTINALVGPSGSGKSTIAKLIASLWDVKSGSISLGGVNIRDMSLEDYNRHIAYVSQDNFLFDDTVMENIRMGNLNASDDEVIAAAKSCGCHDFIMGLEKGYETIVGGAGGHLSGGERQRISIARAMLKNAPIIMQDVNHQLFCDSVEEEIQLGMAEENMEKVSGVMEELDLQELSRRHPMSLSGGQKQRVAIASAILANKSILVFDEPTSGLDHLHMEQTAELIKSLRGKKTVFIVTHDPELILRCCTHVLHIDHGEAAQVYPLEVSSQKNLAAVFPNLR